MLRLTDQADFGLLYDSCERRLEKDEWQKCTHGVLTRDMYAAYCVAKKWPSIGFELNGKPIGGMLFDGKCVHLEVLPEYHGRWGLLWPSAIKWMFAQKDPMLIQIERANEKVHRFMRRNNWPVVEADEKSLTYEVSSRTLPDFLKPDRPVKNRKRSDVIADSARDAAEPANL
jgi:hypothetical protein